MNSAYFYSYTTLKTKFKNLPQEINKLGSRVREDGQEEYYHPNVDVVTVNKIGFRKYLIVWKVSGVLKL